MTTSPRSFVVLLAAVVGLVAAGCSGGSDAATTTTKAPTSTTSSTTTTEPIEDYRSFIATVPAEITTVEVFASPGGEPKTYDVDPTVAQENAADPDEVVTLENPLPSGAPATYLIKALDQTSPQGEAFHEVYLPIRPNGSTGFVRASDVAVSHTDMAIEISLSTHTLTLSDGGDVVVEFPVAVGTADTPTPTGLFFVKELVEPTNEDGAYGPLAYGLSAFSEATLDTEAFADGVIGIHGTNRPELLGTDVSHGCVRLQNENILQLEELQVPLGMPVRIAP